MAIKTRIVHKRAEAVETTGEGTVSPQTRSKFQSLSSLDPGKAKQQKKLIKKKSNPLRALNYAFVLVVLLLVSVNGYFIYQYDTKGYSPTQTIGGLARDSLQVVDRVWEPEVKQTDNYTAVLLMGIDSRVLEFDGEEFRGRDRDIDTIMQVVYNHETGDTFLFSIPRDTGVTITEECADQSSIYFRSINHAYKLAEDGDCPGGGAGIMQKYVSSITGFDNHYYAIISYQAFRDIVDAVGDEKDGEKGLYIDVPRNTQEYYPRESGRGFEAVYFPKGYQFINSDRLLKYARSRKASSDFDRARRQQQVVEAMQAKILSEETLHDPVKLFNLYRSFTDNAMFSELSLDDFRAGVSIMGEIQQGEVYKFVLDDTFGGKNALLTRPSYSNGLHNRPGYYLSPRAYDDEDCVRAGDEYCKVKEYISSIYNNPEVHAEQASIFSYVNVPGSSIQVREYLAGENRSTLPITRSRYAQPASATGEVVQIYDFSEGSKPQSKQLLEQAFQTTVQPKSEAPFSSPLNGEDFAIVVKTN